MSNLFSGAGESGCYFRVACQLYSEWQLFEVRYLKARSYGRESDFGPGLLVSSVEYCVVVGVAFVG